MKKNIVAALVADWEGLSTKDAGDIVDRVSTAILATVAEHGEARIPEFGTFKRKHRASRTVKNPRTGETTTTAEKNALTFKASAKVAL